MDVIGDLHTSPMLPRAFGSVDYWRRRATGVPVAEDALFDKRRKEVHRYDIADVNGRLALTIPIVKPHNRMARWSDVRISDHGEWWHQHRVSLESAYGRTPYFEFYIDRLAPFFNPDTPGRFASILDYNRAADTIISSILLLPDRPTQTAQTAPNAITESCPENQCEPYWQPRRHRLGFIAGLSILDLIFCLGPEAAPYLRR